MVNVGKFAAKADLYVCAAIVRSILTVRVVPLLL
jgi:hypothetical protein